MAVAINWELFCKWAEKLAAAPFSFSDLKSCLFVVDKKAFSDISFASRMGISFGLCRFIGMRRRLLAPSLTAFVKRNGSVFNVAPSEAILAYNALMDAFFAGDQKIAVEKEEPVAPKQQASVELPPLERRVMVEKKMEEFRRAYQGVAPFLFGPYVDGFLKELNEESSEERLLEALEAQKTALEHFDSEVRDGYASLKKRSLSILEQLYKPDLVAYKDLAIRFEKLLQSDLSFQLPEGTCLTPEIILEIEKARHDFFEGQFAAMGALVETGRRRNEKLQEIEQFQKKISSLTARLKPFKDLSKEMRELEEKNHKITTTKKELQKLPFEEIERVIDERYQSYLTFAAETSQLALSLNQRCRELELFGEYGKQTIKRRLFDIFFGITPYKELREDLRSTQAVLVQRLVQLVDAFFAGNLTADEYFSRCQEMAYEHDVVKLRNEVSYRSTRVKDIRDEVIHLFKELSAMRRMLDCIPGSFQEKVYRDITLLFQ
ncbi:MAG: hypothetical protein JSR46_01225, partial [Verrucomicrobia bacterium]|nr:hypothetical protein [Verrucomicrobiota bacterium]